MKCAIVGCGPTAKFFQNNCDSIGINDAWKIKKTRFLLVADPKREFRKQNRLDFIMGCKPEKFYCYYKFTEWENVHNYESYHAIKWHNQLATNKIYTSMSTPFIATSMAVYLGYKEIIIYGADYYNHKNFTPDNYTTKKRFDQELSNFKELSAESEKIGVNIFCGHRASALSEVLRIKRS